ncbi:MAG: flagellar biosynthetic protein FliO [Isosphaeraceae bacterium]|nr:flagellar biosynthetic protein FliO [Isosphaeraceae bacterium]
MIRRIATVLLLATALWSHQAAAAEPSSLPSRENPSSASDAASGMPRHRIPPHPRIDRSPGSTSVGSGSGWGASVGVALALGALGLASWFARRWASGNAGLAGAGPSLRVIGRTSLSGKHAIHLVSVGDRILIVGTGVQSSPSLLGELDETEWSRAATEGGENRDPIATRPRPASAAAPQDSSPKTWITGLARQWSTGS